MISGEINEYMTKDLSWESKIYISAALLKGAPHIKGTNIPIALIFKELSKGIPISEIEKQYPELKTGDIEAALECAAHAFSWTNEETLEDTKEKVEEEK